MKFVGILLTLGILGFLAVMNMKFLGLTLQRGNTSLEQQVTGKRPANPAPTQQGEHASAAQDAIPAYQEAHDTERQTAVTMIANALSQWLMENGGILPEDITSAPKEICRSGAANCFGLIDLSILEGPFLVTIPEDPKTGKEGNGTRYFIQSNGNQFTVSAPDAGTTIAITR